MKNIVRLSTILCSAFLSTQLFAQTPIKDTVSMGSGYANAVYYNLRTGAKSQSAISTWHMSHTTVSRDNCIRLNHLNGVDVYTYPKGSNKDFSTMDTAGWSSWKHLYNDIHTHELGALNQSTNAKDPMDFSWGIYNSTTHEIEGDSLYLFVINTPSVGKVMYPTMGVESKRGERVSKITNYTWDVIATNPPQSIAGIKMTGTPGELSKDLTKIGGDWKAYDGAAMTWNISTDWNYIVETIRIQGTTKDTAFWMLAFTGFSGSAKGETQLKRMELKTSTAAVSQSKQFSAKLFPNPSSDNILIMANGISEKAIVQIIGMDGRLIHSNSHCEFSQGAVQLSVQDLPRGIYFVTIQTNNDKLSLPFIKQ